MEKGVFHPQIKMQKAFDRKPVQHPGIKGGKFWYDSRGNVRYGDKLMVEISPAGMGVSLADVRYAYELQRKIKDAEENLQGLKERLKNHIGHLNTTPEKEIVAGSWVQCIDDSNTIDQVVKGHYYRVSATVSNKGEKGIYLTIAPQFVMSAEHFILASEVR